MEFNLIYFISVVAIVLGIIKIFEEKRGMKTPEEAWSVKIDGKKLSVKGSKGAGVINLEDLQEVNILTTNDGPYYPDFYFILKDSFSEVWVPQGAMGFHDLEPILFDLKNFSKEKVILASISAENQIFHCWKSSQKSSIKSEEPSPR